jgi:hypothetical protein
MIAHTKELLQSWRGGGVIISPRDLTEKQILKVAESALAAGGVPLLDPQCFARDATWKKLTDHSYWEAIKEHATGAFTGGAGTDALLEALATLAKSAGISRHILPGCLARPVSDDWFALEEAILKAAPHHFDGDDLIATVALSSAALLDEVQVEAVVERAAAWDVQGFYVVAEVPPNSYLVDNPVWVGNLLILLSGLKLLEKDVILGYGNHQLLCAASAKLDVLASGTWLNVRAFKPDKFYAPDEDDISRRATWYYCPQALSEYKIPFLDIAHSVGMLPKMVSSTPYAAPLFAGASPGTIEWGESDAFRHYLTALRGQVSSARQASFNATLAEHRRLLDAAERLLTDLAAAGIRGQDRDFRDIVDVNRAALAKLESARGARLRRGW